MVFRPLYLNVVVRVMLLAASCMLFAFAWVGKGNYFTLINLGVLTFLQIILFIHYMNKTNSELAYFFESIKNEEAGISFSRAKRKFSRLYQAMDEVNKQIKVMRIRYASQDQYFKTIVESIQTGLITFDQEGKVDLMNKSAKNMLGVQSAFKVDKLNETQPGLADILYGISPSEKRLFRVNTGSEAILLSISNSVLKFSDRELKIITFHDIHQEMDRNEQESWQKLIQILNHEIMNSLAPIISTSAALKNILESKGSGAYQSSDQQRDHLVEKTVSGLSIIHERSEGLKSFVENYKMLNTIPQPVISTFMIKDLFDSCKTLLEEALQSSHIKCSCEINPPGMDLEADKAQILQILINLMKNSIESLSAKVIEDKVILLKAFYTERGKTSIQVRDNGKGIAPELIDQIFIPFFTTRERGSGIGLSLSRQIMHAHHGTLSVYSIPDHITVFTLTF